MKLNRQQSLHKYVKQTVYWQMITGGVKQTHRNPSKILEFQTILEHAFRALYNEMQVYESMHCNNNNN